MHYCLTCSWPSEGGWGEGSIHLCLPSCLQLQPLPSSSLYLWEAVGACPNCPHSSEATMMTTEALVSYNALSSVEALSSLGYFCCLTREGNGRKIYILRHVNLGHAAQYCMKAIFHLYLRNLLFWLLLMFMLLKSEEACQWLTLTSFWASLTCEKYIIVTIFYAILLSEKSGYFLQYGEENEMPSHSSVLTLFYGKCDLICLFCVLLIEALCLYVLLLITCWSALEAVYHSSLPGSTFYCAVLSCILLWPCSYSTCLWVLFWCLCSCISAFLSEISYLSEVYKRPQQTMCGNAVSWKFSLQWHSILFMCREILSEKYSYLSRYRLSEKREMPQTEKRREADVLEKS